MTAYQILEKARLEKTAWCKIIIHAQSVGEFNNEARRLASLWTDCACGVQDHRIPRWKISGRDERRVTRKVDEPKDKRLRTLGFRFSQHVNRNQYNRAARTLIAIEHRAAEILAEMEKEK